MTKILLVEDEPLVARMMQKTLEFEKFQVELGIGGREGLDKAVTTKPDLILLDVMMPEPDGMEVLELLKSNPVTSKIPVVMLSNLSGNHDAELAKSKGAVDYWMKKDAKPGELGKRIRSILAA